MKRFEIVGHTAEGAQNIVFGIKALREFTEVVQGERLSLTEACAIAWKLRGDGPDEHLQCDPNPSMIFPGSRCKAANQKFEELQRWFNTNPTRKPLP